MMTPRRRVVCEPLEVRTLLSFSFHDDHGALHAAAAKGGGAGGGGAPGPAIRLDLVALHELGHSLGLGHDGSAAVSIMDPYYNPDYDPATMFKPGVDPAIDVIRAIYQDVATSGWKDPLDAEPGDGQVDLTYSFMRDGARMDQGSNSLFATFDRAFGAGNWQPVFAQELARWSAVSGPTASQPKLTFRPLNGTGVEAETLAVNATGKAQNDSRFGDIRIGAHRFDGTSKTLAHAYSPPTDSQSTRQTVAGDAHFDQAENWVLPPTTAASTTAGPASPGTDLATGEATTLFFGGRPVL